MNGIDRLGFEEEALGVARSYKVSRVRNFHDLSKWIQANISRYQISKEKNKEYYSWEKMMTQKKEVFLVNLIGTQGINLVVFVDMGKRNILGGEEKYPMLLNEE